MTAAVSAMPTVNASITFAARLPKTGGEFSECEDRFGWEVVAGNFRAAVGDGASASLLAGEWAELLVSAWCTAEDVDRSALVETIAAKSDVWNQMVNQRQLPWYALAKRENGAFAALVGVCVQADGNWTATAAGDSCMFQVRRQPGESGGCIFAFPLSRPGQFGSTPDLIGTKSALEARSFGVSEGSWSDGDDFYLMTDALAEWFLGEVQQKREPWRWFDALEVPSNPMPFEKLIGDLRGSGKLKDDDVTLLHIKLSGGERVN